MEWNGAYNKIWSASPPGARKYSNSKKHLNINIKIKNYQFKGTSLFQYILIALDVIALGLLHSTVSLHSGTQHRWLWVKKKKTVPVSIGPCSVCLVVHTGGQQVKQSLTGVKTVRVDVGSSVEIAIACESVQ